MNIRKLKISDGRNIYKLAESCPPLDVNSIYCYYLVSAHFADTSAIAEEGGDPIGFVSAYRPPATPEALFVWQVAVSPDHRGKGVAGRLLEHIVARPDCAGIERLEVTVGPSNAASEAVFKAFAHRRGLALRKRPFLTAADFGDISHEDEVLLTIGPLDIPPNRHRHERIQSLLP